MSRNCGLMKACAPLSAGAATLESKSIYLSSGPGQVPRVGGQLEEIHVDEGGPRVLLAPGHCCGCHQAGIVRPRRRRLLGGDPQPVGRLSQLHVRRCVP